MPLTDEEAISGVGGIKASVAGHGTIKVILTFNGQDYILELHNVLYVPSNQNNLISLEYWNAAGGQYLGGGGALILVTKDGNRIGYSKKINNHLYKMMMSIRKSILAPTKTHTANPQTFVGREPAMSWDIWHRRYGHVGYSGLQQLLDRNLVNRLYVDK